MSARTAPLVAEKVAAPTIRSLRELALRQAAAWNDNSDGLRETTNLMEWRDNCRDEVRDEVLGSQEGDALLASWVNAFDGAVHGVSDAADDIVCAIETVNGLLRLALDQLQSVTDNHADVAIRGAKRFIDDIRDIAKRLPENGGTVQINVEGEVA